MANSSPSDQNNHPPSANQDRPASNPPLNARNLAKTIREDQVTVTLNGPASQTVTPTLSQNSKEPKGAAPKPDPRALAKTVRDGAVSPSAKPQPQPGLSQFRGRRVQSFLTSSGSEADILIIRNQAGGFEILRLYRQGRAPKPEIFQRLVKLSNDMDGLAVRILEAGYDEETGRWFEIQEYITGGELSSLIAQGPLDRATLVELTKEMAEALHRLHGLDVIHRDVKPDNILVRALNPLKIALSDFGISSLLAPDISIKETRLANTPLYSAPESFGSIVGKSADWWSLGMVILEAALGYHPMANLSFNEVLREITTRGVQPPVGLPRDLNLLLKGLLTRDDRKRWRYPEVSAWLKGQKNIPVYYETVVETQKETPYILDGQEYNSPEELAVYMAQGADQWEKGREHLARGYVRKWLENRKMFDQAVKTQVSAGSPDAATFNFILAFAPQLGPVYWGQVLSFNNLAHNLANRGRLAKGPSRVLGDLLDGRLSSLIGLAAANNQPFDEKTAALLAHKGPVSPETLAMAIAVAEDPSAYVFGEKGPPNSPGAAIRFATQTASPLIDLAWWRANIPKKAILPRDVFEGGLNRAETYRAGAERLTRLKEEGIFRRSFLRRFQLIEVPGLGQVRVSPLTARETTNYFRWLALSRENQNAGNFEECLKIDAEERGTFGRRVNAIFRPSLFLGLVLFLIIGLIPLVWALDGLNLVHLTSYGISADLVVKYRAIQNTVYIIAAIGLGVSILYTCLCHPRLFLVLIFLGIALIFVFVRHKATFAALGVYPSWIVYGGFFIFCLNLAYKVTYRVFNRLRSNSLD
ncbi:MAG: protein kinase [Deltaproteobacteria bacterium]|jgi:serine/threonine protein kinase|nr:protein kinase [Deltaproteobacteria bacterium]